MTSTQTRNISDSVNQVIRLINSGAQMVRITTPAMKDVEALQSIITELRAQITTPIIADVHYLPEVAMAVAPFVDKVRINPGISQITNLSVITISAKRNMPALCKQWAKKQPL